ncbi:LCP family protein [Schaalia suimastitidis]|uniref:LCP family protein n=1 Tax=Schaalia suimastitidis TaxID=121163 RepID=UPI000407437C|nr:LCP family protein [Schaalia suimastitidis]
MAKELLNNDRGQVTHAATEPYRFGALRTFFAIVLTLVLFVTSTAVGIYLDLAKTVSNSALDISGFDVASDGKETQEELPADSFAGRPITLLVVGIDSRYDQTGDSFGSAEEISTIRSDTTMVAHLSADRTRLQVVSIPRDTLVDIPPCKRSDGSTSPRQYDAMFNDAFATGAVTNDVAAGVACTKSTVEELTGLTIDGFVVVDFTGFRSMVDALGGVWMQFDEPLYDHLSGLDVPAGCQLLGADQALALARARKNLGDGSDLSRIGRQQQLVGAMLKTLASKNILTDLPQLLSFLKATISSLQVSPNLSDINADAGLMLSLANLQRDQIQFVMMPVLEAPSDPNRVIENTSVTAPLWAALQNDQPLPAGITYRDASGNELTVPDPTAPTVTDPNAAATTSETTPSTTTTDTATTQAPNADTATTTGTTTPQPQTFNSLADDSCPPKS